MLDSITSAEVSVIIPCYRCADTIERAIASVAAQTLPPVEVILVEDQSGDGTLDALFAQQALYPDGWISILVQPTNSGPGEARNAGWKEARQPYIAFLDADDTWHPQKVELQYHWMLQHPRVALSGHSIAHSDSHTGLSASMQYNVWDATFEEVTASRLLWRNVLSTPTVMLQTSLLPRFETGKRHSEDYLLWLTIACSGETITRCRLPLAFIHKGVYGEAGLSGQLWNMQKGQWDTYRRLRRLDCVGPVQYVLLLLWSWIRFVRRLGFVGMKRGGTIRPRKRNP